MANESTIRFSFKRKRFDKMTFKVYLPGNRSSIGVVETYGAPVSPSWFDVNVKAGYFKYVDEISNQFLSFITHGSKKEHP